MRKAYLYCRKRQNPPGIEVLNFLFFRFILDYNYQSGRNVEQMKTVKQCAHSKMCEQIKVPVVKFQR